MILLKSKIAMVPSDDILFFRRPLPPENTDLILYVEDQVAELLFAEEALSDVMYRFTEAGNGLLIAVARKKILQQQPLAATAASFRVPSAAAVWMRGRSSLPPDRKSLLFAQSPGRAWLLLADQRSLLNVVQLNKGPALERDLLQALDSLHDELTPSPAVMLCGEPVSEHLKKELRDRSIECAPLPAAAETPAREVLDEWDFRLPEEAAAQQLQRQKLRVVQASALTAAGMAALWLVLAGCNKLLGHIEQRQMHAWQALRPSLKEITYLQKTTRDLMTEITLCRKLTEKRTRRASVLQAIAATRPPQVMLGKLLVGERKKRFDKTAGDAVSEDRVTILGSSEDSKGITAWMEQLLKNGTFLSVNLVSMEKEGGRYRFQIECELPATAKVQHS